MRIIDKSGHGFGSTYTHSRDTSQQQHRRSLLKCSSTLRPVASWAADRYSPPVFPARDALGRPRPLREPPRNIALKKSCPRRITRPSCKLNPITHAKPVSGEAVPPSYGPSRFPSSHCGTATTFCHRPQTLCEMACATLEAPPVLASPAAHGHRPHERWGHGRLDRRVPSPN